MPDDSSEARNATVFAISSRRVTRPRAICPAIGHLRGWRGRKRFPPQVMSTPLARIPFRPNSAASPRVILNDDDKVHDDPKH